MGQSRRYHTANALTHICCCIIILLRWEKGCLVFICAKMLVLTETIIHISFKDELRYIWDRSQVKFPITVSKNKSWCRKFNLKGMYQRETNSTQDSDIQRLCWQVKSHKPTGECLRPYTLCACGKFLSLLSCNHNLFSCVLILDSSHHMFILEVSKTKFKNGIQWASHWLQKYWLCQKPHTKFQHSSSIVVIALMTI